MMEKFAAAFARGPGIALVLAGASVAVLWGIMRYASRGIRRAPRVLGPDPNKTVKLPLIKITQISHDTKIFRCVQKGEQLENLKISKSQN